MPPDQSCREPPPPAETKKQVSPYNSSWVLTFELRKINYWEAKTFREQEMQSDQRYYGRHRSTNRWAALPDESLGSWAFNLGRVGWFRQSYERIWWVCWEEAEANPIPWKPKALTKLRFKEVEWEETTDPRVDAHREAGKTERAQKEAGSGDESCGIHRFAQRQEEPKACSSEKD